MTIDEIKKYWEAQAALYGQSHMASWSDQKMIDLEINEITKWISEKDMVLDVGCANGFSTLRYASARNINIKGIDYIEKMIKSANQALKEFQETLIGNVQYAVGNIMALDEESDTYNTVISTRVIINLGNWDNQLLALKECVRVLKRNGRMILSEATVQGWRALNDFRNEWGLENIPMPAFNTYLDQEKVIMALERDCELIKVSDYASSYYVGTRVLKPLLIKALGENIDAANPNMEWNNWFSEIPAAGKYGIQKLFIFRKI